MINTNDFSVNACYAVLSASPEEEPLYAILKMVVAIVEEEKYSKLDPQILSKKFFQKFHFKLPYHPMQTIIQLGIEKGYFEYNSSLKSVLPVRGAIDSGEFFKMLKNQEIEYQNLLLSFDQFLQNKYSLYSSNQELSDQVQAFVQRYGLVSKTNKGILRKVKNDFKFADYLLDCWESGDTTVLDYMDKYTTGVAFAETLTFHVPPKKYKNCHANVYLDTGFVFALLGIGSKDRSESFEDLFNDMVHLGMTPMIYQHTYDEIAGIIDNARMWINNNSYNPALASETAYYFVTNNWSYQKATELLGDLRQIITENYHIQIDNPPYPDVYNIHTKHEEDIKQMIIDEYLRRNEKFSVKDKDHTINQDARSLFMTLHLDKGHVAHALHDVNNVFITTNRTLAKVGRQLTSEIVHNSGMCIPIALTDLVWGTLIWANSPAKVSPLNRANIISAAYAAFQPSEEILEKLNKTLDEQETSGNLSPEKCYFLKTNAVALKILSQKTQNDELNYSDQTPFEILKELQAEGYEAGFAEKQKETDQLLSEKQREMEQLRTSIDKISSELVTYKQIALIESVKSKQEQKEVSLASAKQHLKDVEGHLTLINRIQEEVEQETAHKCKIFKTALIVLLVVYVLILCAISVEKSWLVSLIGVIVPALAWVLSLVTKHEFTPKTIVANYQKYILNKTRLKYQFNATEYSQLITDRAKALADIKRLESELTSISNELKVQFEKIDEFSIDINLLL